METRRIDTPFELDSLAEEILSILPVRDRAHVLALSGDLGAGKTAFVQALARRLGISAHVGSPTFVIMRTYQTDLEISEERFDTLVHIDAYRIEDERELEVLRVSERFSAARTIVCIEWPERVPGIVPQDAIRMRIAVEENGARKFSYSAYGGA